MFMRVKPSPWIPAMSTVKSAVAPKPQMAQFAALTAGPPSRDGAGPGAPRAGAGGGAGRPAASPAPIDSGYR